MANLTKKEKHIVEMYVRYFGTVATEEQIKSFDGVKSLSEITADIRKDADNSKIGITSTEFLNDVFQNLFGRDANPKDLKYVKTIDNNKNLPIATIIKNGSRDDKAVYNTKKLVAQMVAAEGGSYELANINQDNYLSIYNAKKGLLVSTVADLEAKISNVPDIINGKTYTLTADVNTGKEFVGTAKNDLFLATKATDWSVGDSLDGGKGIDTLKIINTAAITISDVPVGGSLKNVEILDLISGADVTANTTSIDGVTHLYTTSKGGNTSTAAATTDINVTNTDIAATAEVIAVKGGKDVTVVSKNNVIDTITVGTLNGAVVSDAAAGKVSVTSTGAAGTATLGAITVNGGTEITVNQNAGNVVNTTNSGGAITVNGNASTTTVTVNQSAINTAGADVVGYVAGTVTITDRNATTVADTISTVTLKNYGASTIVSSALSTLNLESTGATASGTLALNTTAADTTVLPTTLTVNSKGGSFGAVSGTMAATYTAVNINSSANTTIADATFAANKTLTVDGAGVTTFAAFTGNTALESIVSKGAGLTIDTQLATNVAVTGGAGVENIKIGATTKTVDLGAGDDIATISVTAFGAGGSLNGGAGNDTLVANTNGSNIAGLPHIVGFETLRVEGAAAQGSHNAHTFKALEIGATAGATTFTNVAAGVGLTVLAAPTGLTTVTLANATGTADVFDLTLKSAAAINAGTVDLDGVETINVNSVDTGSVTAAHVNTLILTDGAADVAKSIVVTGDAGVNFSTTNLTKVTNFDASAVTAGAVTFTSGNTTTGEVVTIKGGAGDDTLTGSVTANDIITGGAGDDTLVYTGRADTFTGGAGNDTFEINALGTKALHLTITDLTKGDKIDLAGVTNDSAALSSFVTAKVTLGAAATFDNYLDAAAAGDGSSDSIARWFQFEGNTYLVNDNTAGAFAATDAVIKITGLVDLSTATYNTGTDIITIA